MGEEKEVRERQTGHCRRRGGHSLASRPLRCPGLGLKYQKDDDEGAAT